MARYLRYAALGDSATVGVGDPVHGGWRGWARLLADSLETAYDVSYCNLATLGATSTSVLEQQLDDAVAHRPDVASLIVGMNDMLKSTWDPDRLHHDLMTCADALTGQGALLLTARFHDHSPMWPLPRRMKRALQRRTDELNEVWDEVYACYGGLRIDFGAREDILHRKHWSADRLHPSEIGHRFLARTFADQLVETGLSFEPPGLEPAGGKPTSWLQDLAWVVAEGVPWFGRRARDLGPWLLRRTFPVLRAPEPVALPAPRRPLALPSAAEEPPVAVTEPNA